MFHSYSYSILNGNEILMLLVLLLRPPHSYIVSKLTPLQVDFVSYMDELAGLIGARPSLPWLFFTDYQLYRRVLWGPVTAYQYRLMGPGKWEGARTAIFTQFDRMNQALKTRKVHKRLRIPTKKSFQAANVSFTLYSQCCYKSASTRWRKKDPPRLDAC